MKESKYEEPWHWQFAITFVVVLVFDLQAQKRAERFAECLVGAVKSTLSSDGWQIRLKQRSIESLLPVPLAQVGQCLWWPASAVAISLVPTQPSGGVAFCWECVLSRYWRGQQFFWGNVVCREIKAKPEESCFGRWYEWVSGSLEKNTINRQVALWE